MRNYSIPSMEHVRRFVPGSVAGHSEQCGWQNVLLTELVVPSIIPAERGVLPVSPAYRIGLMLQGNVNINSRLGGERWNRGPLTTGGWFFLPDRQEFNFSWGSDTLGLCKALHFHLSLQLFANAAEETLDMDSRLIELPYKMNLHDPLLYQLAIAMQHQLKLQSTAGTSYAGKLYAETASQLMALHVLCNHSTRPRKLKTYRGGLPKYKLQLVLDYIECHLSEDLSLHTLAQMVNISTYYFARLFKQSMDITLHQYITDRRMQCAKFLLKQTQLSVSAIAQTVGYQNSTHFCNAFKRIHKLTPGQYRLT